MRRGTFKVDKNKIKSDENLNKKQNVAPRNVKQSGDDNNTNKKVRDLSINIK